MNDLRRSISPSAMSTVLDCPRRYQYTYVEGRRTRPGEAAVAGTTVHTAMELWFALPPGQRTAEALEGCIDDACRAIVELDDFAALELDAEQTTKFFAKVTKISRNYLEMDEEADEVDVVQLETKLRSSLDGWELVGIIDRLDRVEHGLAVVDWKSGRAPSEKYEAKAMLGLHFYSLLVEHTMGEPPVEASLVFLGERRTIMMQCSERRNRTFERRLTAVIDMIERSYAVGEFTPKPSRLCGWCDHKAHCPAAPA